jgi:murein L,D-transpeptidase YcbB/YkuD
VLWLDAPGSAAQVQALTDALARADRHGLEPADYDAAGVATEWAAIANAPTADAARAARLDVALSSAALRYLSDVHRGRVAPERVHRDVVLARPPYDAPARLRDALQAGRLAALLEEAPPRLPQYAKLVRARAQYAARTGQPAPPPLPPVTKLEPGGDYRGLAALRTTLVELGDLDPSVALPPRYEGAVVEAVRAFQVRHGLSPDGVVGRATLAALEVPPAQRVRQIELAMERLRWVPEWSSRRVVVINIPEFELRLFEGEPGAGAGRGLVWQTPVIVGKAAGTRTPVFVGDMQWVEFSPYWNVPPSILHNEVLPRLRRDPGYLGREDMEFVLADGRGTRTEASAATIDAAARGELRVRQRPGAKNALGGVKFVLPNTMNIYLHDTPTRALFAESRRDFSHGCIRVREPAQLAGRLLAELPSWNGERIGAAMQAGRTQVVRLPEAVPVLVFYTTVVADADGALRFLPDIYGYDRELDAALRARR